MYGIVWPWDLQTNVELGDSMMVCGFARNRLDFPTKGRVVIHLFLGGHFTAIQLQSIRIHWVYPCSIVQYPPCIACCLHAHRYPVFFLTFPTSMFALTGHIPYVLFTWLLRCKSSHGGFWFGSCHSWGIPHSWLVFDRENPHLKWRMTGGSPMTKRTPPFRSQRRTANLKTGPEWSWTWVATKVWDVYFLDQWIERGL